MEDVRLILDLVLALGAAFAGGLLARQFGQPVLLGYVLAGIVIGPNTPGLFADRERVLLMANLGVAFLMFALGVEFSFNELKRFRRVATISAGFQIPLTVALGTVAGLAIGWSIEASLLLGGVFAISSSIVAIKLLQGRGEVDSPHGRIALGLGIMQDLSLVPMLALVPVLAHEGGNLGLTLLRSLAIAAIALFAVGVLGSRVVPRILYFIAQRESRELFLLTIVVIALGTAWVSHEVGLSVAIGAFLAGLVVSESEFDSQVLAEIIPLRDLFSTLFFVSVGMLIDIGFVFRHLPLVAALTATLVGGKLLIAGGAYLAAGVAHRSATLASIVMAQIGEFSFVLAGVGLAQGIIAPQDHALMLAVALGSILAVAMLLRAAPLLVATAERLPGVASQEAEQAGPEPESEPLNRHVVICGYGRVGRVLGDALERRGLRYSVIDINPAIVRDLRQRGIPAYYGDAGSDALLLRAGIERARTIAVATDDLVTARAAIRHARLLNPTVSVITRATQEDEVELLRTAGADEVVQPEFEAGLEFVRHILRRHGVAAREVNAILGRRRTSYYQASEAPFFAEEE
ncbi:MAG: cation:proton antiporter [Thermomicrobiales bacterium]